MDTPVMITKGSASGSTPTVISGVSAPAGSVLCISGYISDSDLAAPTVSISSSPSLTWEGFTETSEDPEGDTRERRVFLTCAYVASAFSGSITFGHADSSVTLASYKVYYVPNASGYHWSADTGNRGVSSTPNKGLDALTSPSNGTIAEIVTSASVTNSDGQTLLDIQNVGEVYYKTGDNSLNWTLDSAEEDWAVVAVEILAQTNQTITPGVVGLVTTKYAPGVQQGTTLTPNVLALATTKYVPSINAGFVVTPGMIALVDTHYAPLIGAGIVVPTRAVVITAFAPDAGTPGVYVPVTNNLIISRHVPVVSTPRLATPDKLSLVTATFAPQFTIPIVARAGLTELQIELLVPRARYTKSGLIVPYASARRSVEL